MYKIILASLVSSQLLFAEPPQPLEVSRAEIGAIFRAMPSKMDAIVNITTQLNSQYQVQVIRKRQICMLGFQISYIPIPGGPTDAYQALARLTSTTGPLPDCR